MKKEWTKDLEKVALANCGIYRIEDEISPDCPKLSTLLLWGNHELSVIPESFFSKMKGLCTLDLYETKIRMLLEDCIKLETVPYLGKLKALRELNLSGTAIKEVPQGVEELSNLRFFSIDARGLKMLPKGVLPKLFHLQHLNLPLHMQVEIEEMENVKQLQKFGGGMKNVNDFNKFIRIDGVHDPCYRIEVNSKNASRLRFGKRHDFRGKNNELVLCASNIKDEKLLGQGIVYLTIRECESLSTCFVDDLQWIFDNPTSLKKLDISTCGGIEWILRSDGQGCEFTLQEIELKHLDDLKCVVMERGNTYNTILCTYATAYVFLS